MALMDILVNETDLVPSLILTGGQLLGQCHSDGCWGQELSEHQEGGLVCFLQSPEIT